MSINIINRGGVNIPTIKVTEKEKDWIMKYSPYRKRVKDTGKGKSKHDYGVRLKPKKPKKLKR